MSLWSGTALVDAAIAVTLVEWAGLALYHRITGRGLPASDYALNLLSGLCLMLALRSVLQGQGWVWSALFLAASGVAHGVYLRQRWKKIGADQS